MKNFYRR